MSISGEVRPFFAVPNAGFAPGFVESWGMTCAGLQKLRIGWFQNFAIHDPALWRGRNHLAHEFLKTPASHLFFLDSDVGWSPRDLFGVLASDHDVAGIAYPIKGEPGGFNVNPLERHRTGQERLRIEDGWLEVQELATGFMCIRRDVVEAVAAAHPELVCVSDHPGFLGQAYVGIFDPFTTSPPQRRPLSEDYAFCARARACGFRVMCWPRGVLSHEGEMVWKGSFDQWLSARVTHDAETSTVAAWGVPAPTPSSPGEAVEDRGAVTATDHGAAP